MDLTGLNEGEFVRNQLEEFRAQGRSEAWIEGWVRGWKKGVAEGEAKFGRLAVILLKEGSIDLLKRVCVDSQERKKQYERFGIN